MTIKELWELRDRSMKDYLVAKGSITPEICKEAARHAESALVKSHPEGYAQWLKIRDDSALDLPIHVRFLQYFGMFTYPRPTKIENVLKAYYAMRYAEWGFDMPSAVKSKARLFTWQELFLSRQCSILSELGIPIYQLKRALT